MMDKTSLRRIGCLSVLFLAISLFLFNKQLHFLSNEIVSSFDGRIELSWDSVPSKRYDGIRVCISDKNGSLLQETELAPEEHSVTFADGKHGDLYHFILQLVRNGKVIEKSKTLSAIFYRSSDVKKVPLIVFDTDSGSDPQFEVVRPRSGYSGLGIKGNKFESGSFQLVCSDSRTECPARIKVRGNTSAVSGFGGGKVPYKISFSEPVSLLSSCPEVRSSEWVLLKCNNINTYYGYLIAKRCQSVWTPQFGFVDMVVNGDWKGSYLLIQDPKEGTVSAEVGSRGFLVENDAYFWNSDYYFKTDKQLNEMGYTVKYPSLAAGSTDAVDIDMIIDRVSRFEDSVYDLSGMLERVNIESFVNWILVHDIMGTSDSDGANMYLFCPNAQVQDWQLSMGTTWDFDTAYGAWDVWSNSHRYATMYYNILFSNERFSGAYEKRWNDISGDLVDLVYSETEKLSAEYGDDIQESWRLDAARWNYEEKSFRVAIEQSRQWIEYRTSWISNALAQEKEMKNAAAEDSGSVQQRNQGFVMQVKDVLRWCKHNALYLAGTALCGVFALVFIAVIYLDVRYVGLCHPGRKKPDKTE